MYTPSQIEAAACAAHEVNRAFCREVLDDNSHLQWKDTPAHIRESVIAGARAIADNPQLPPAASHESWLEYKRAEGWVFGETKSLDHKTHPCMVAFDQLPLGDRVKDSLFGIVVRTSLGIEHHASIDVCAEDIKTDPGRGQLGQ
jgi:hypothetical protein